MKNLLTKLSLTVPSLVLAATALVAVPVLAEDGGSSGGDTATTTSSGSGGSGDNSGGSDSAETAATGSTATETETQTETNDKHQGALLLAELRKSGRHHTAAEQKLACEAHKAGLNMKFQHITLGLTNFNTRVDGFLTKAESYQKASSLTVANWDSLVASATAADTTSDGSIAALKAVTPSLDCNNTSAAQDVATFKVAALQARTDLQAYKKAVRAVFTALMNAKGSTSDATSTTTTSGGGQ